MIYIFQHLPKCGGNTFIECCSPWFAAPRVHDYAGKYPGEERIAEFAKTRPDLDSLPPDSLVCGHLVREGIRPHERYGDFIAQGKCQILSVVRDPLSRAISGYYHRVRVGRMREQSLREFLERLRNPMAKQLGCHGRADWSAWLDKYYFICVCNHMQLSFDVLAAKLGKPRVDALQLNQSPRGTDDLTPDEIARFGTRNVQDYAIFDYAVDRLRREAAAVGIAASI
jgi:hypothetical protein